MGASLLNPTICSLETTWTVGSRVWRQFACWYEQFQRACAHLLVAAKQQVDTVINVTARMYL